MSWLPDPATTRQSDASPAPAPVDPTQTPEPITADQLRTAIAAAIRTAEGEEGYDAADVDALVQTAAGALSAAERGEPVTLTADDVLGSMFHTTTAGGGYDEDDVDFLLDCVAATLRPVAPPDAG